MGGSPITLTLPTLTENRDASKRECCLTMICREERI